MANETIADIIAEIRREMPVYASGILCSNMTEVAVHEFADRIEAAHKREIIVERNLGTDEIDMAVAAKDATIARLTEALKSIVSYGENKSSMDDPCAADYWIVRNIARAALAAEGGTK